MFEPENPKGDIHSRESNQRPYDCKADAVPHDHRHHILLNKISTKIKISRNFSLIFNFDYK